MEIAGNELWFGLEQSLQIVHRLPKGDVCF
jgi:hypothetical protein